jgi:type II secretory pathway component PulJ
MPHEQNPRSGWPITAIVIALLIMASLLLIAAALLP